MKDKISVKNYLEYLDTRYPIFSDMRMEDEFRFFTYLIRNIIDSTSEISKDDKIFVYKYFDAINNEFWNKLQEQKQEHATKPKYSAEYAFNVIRTLNCSLEDKLKIAELFEYTE